MFYCLALEAYRGIHVCYCGSLINNSQKERETRLTFKSCLLTPEKHKLELSGLSRMKLQLAYSSLLKLKRAIMCKGSKEVADPNEPQADPELEDLEQAIDMTQMLSVLESELEGSQPEVQYDLSYETAFH